MFDLQDFIDRCQRLVRSREPAKQVLGLMRNAVKEPEPMKKAIAPAARLSDAYLFRSEDLLVLNATVPPHFVSPAHDHRIWAVIGIYEGQENNTFYRRSSTELEEVGRREVLCRDAVLLGPEVIHAIANPLRSATLGLHVYGGDLSAIERSMWHPYTGEELPYDSSQFFTWCAELTKSRGAA
jgi:predicted metal-dependent enzyme (double-stranded beta helix superfamily)